jgi:hypothetical protein
MGGGAAVEVPVELVSTLAVELVVLEPRDPVVSVVGLESPAGVDDVELVADVVVLAEVVPFDAVSPP